MDNNSKIKVVASTGVLVVLICALLFLASDRYVRRDYYGDLNAVWNSHVLYVFVQKNTTMERVPVWELLLAKTTGLSGGDEPHTKSDLLIFQISDGPMSNYVQPSFDINGQLFVSSNKIYLMKGGSIFTGFEFEQNRFAELAASKVTELGALMRASKGLFPNDWHKLDWKDLGYVGDNYDKTFDFAGFSQSAKLHIKKGQMRLTKDGYLESNPPIDIELALLGQRHQLMRLNQNYERITAKEFKDCVGPK